MTNELIKVTTNDQGQKLVSGRELHEVLEIGRDFTTWMKKMIEYGFQENVDFTTIWNDTKTGVVVEYNGNSNSMVKRGYSVDYILTLDMAKHIAMVQRTEIGMQVRNYFLECEKIALQQMTPSYMIADPIERARRWIVEQEERMALEQQKEQLLLETQKLTEEIEAATEEILHKEDVIIGLTKDVTLADLRQRISRVIRHGGQGRYAERYALLYKEFEEKHHVSVGRRMKRDIANGTCKKSINKMEYICEVMDMTVELYEVAVKVFESDFAKLLGEIQTIIQNGDY